MSAVASSSHPRVFVEPSRCESAPSVIAPRTRTFENWCARWSSKLLDEATVHGSHMDTATVHGSHMDTATVHGSQMDEATVHGSQMDEATVHGSRHWVNLRVRSHDA